MIALGVRTQGRKGGCLGERLEDAAPCICFPHRTVLGNARRKLRRVHRRREAHAIALASVGS
jgi:hypothetical protein